MIDRERLLATAAELGITIEAVEQAEKQIVRQKREAMIGAEFDAIQRREFNTHLISYLIINIFLLGMNLATGIREVWFVYPLLGWGIGLAFHAVAALNRSSGMYQDSREKFVRSRSSQVSEENRELPELARTSEDKTQLVIGIHTGSMKRRQRD